MMPNPVQADTALGGVLARLVARMDAQDRELAGLKALLAQKADLEQLEVVTVGGTQATVVYADGTPRVVSFPVGFTTTPGKMVAVLNTPAYAFIVAEPTV